VYEVCIKLCFNEPCLGNVRQADPEPNLMERNPEGNVIFSAVWWRSITERAARVYNRHQSRILDIMWNAEVDGTPQIYKRYYNVWEDDKKKKRFKNHEAFLRGDVIGLRALIPNDIPMREFEEIMSMAGEYFGISPFGWRKGYGKFKVTLVERMHDRRRREHEESGDVCKGDNAGDTPPDTGDDRGGGESNDIPLPRE
jgi:hypothetical protein